MNPTIKPMSGLLGVALLLGAAACRPAADGTATAAAEPAASASPADTPAWNRYAAEPDALQGAALYWSLRGGDPDYEQLGRMLLPDWPRDGDAFARQDRIAAFRPIFEQALRAAASQRYFVFDTVGDLGHYDAATRAFPLRIGNLGALNPHYFANATGAESHQLRLVDLAAWSAIAVADEAIARRIEAMVSRNDTRLRLYLFAEGAESGGTLPGDPLSVSREAMSSFNGRPKPGSVRTRIQRIAVIDADGGELAAALPSAGSAP